LHSFCASEVSRELEQLAARQGDFIALDGDGSRSPRSSRRITFIDESLQALG
jgi:hypothetical protein